MQIFYAPDITTPFYTLNEEESKHCIRVLRLTTGDDITLVDGVGNIYKTKISKPEAKRCEVEVLETINNFEQRGFYLHLAVAPTKNIERFEWFLEKATERGATMLFDAQTSPLFFSSQMKYNHIDLRLSHIDYINRLAAG